MLNFQQPLIQSSVSDPQHDPRSKFPIWIKQFATPLRSFDWNKMTRKPTPKFAICTRKFQSESKDSRNPIRSSELNQIIHDPRSIVWLFTAFALIEITMRDTVMVSTDYEIFLFAGVEIFYINREGGHKNVAYILLICHNKRWIRPYLV